MSVSSLFKPQVKSTPITDAIVDAASILEMHPLPATNPYGSVAEGFLLQATLIRELAKRVVELEKKS